MAATSLIGKLFGKRETDAAPTARDLERAEQKRRRRMARQLKRDTSAFERIIIERLTQMDICFRERQKKGGWGQKVEKVRFCECCASPEAVYLRVDTRRLPRGTRTSMLSHEETIADLSYACRRSVRVRSTIRGGFWYVIDREEGVHGVPRLVRYEDILTMIPSTAGPLVVPVGAGENQRLKYADLSNMTHVLIGGATGAGKSVWVNQALCTLIQRNQPRDLRIVMVDLKGGVELAFYKGLPHLLQPIITRRGDVVPALEMLYEEVERRLNLFEGICRDIRGWNYQHRTDDQRLPIWLLVVDELANVMLDKSVKSDAERLLADIAARGRAPGVHCVVATQRPSVNVVTGLIKANFPTRIAFSCADMASSRTILDTSDAYALAPAGRMVFYMGAKKQELQGPLLTDRQVDEIVKRVKSGVVEAVDLPGHDVTPREIMEYALENFGGACSYRELYAVFSERGVSEGELRDWLADIEGVGFELDGLRYKLHPGAGSRPRMLKPLDPPAQGDVENDELDEEEEPEDDDKDDQSDVQDDSLACHVDFEQDNGDPDGDDSSGDLLAVLGG